MGAVTIPVTEACGLVHKVPAVEVVLKTVGIVVLTLGTIGFGFVGPDIILQIGMFNIHTGIKNSNHRTFVGNRLLLLEKV